MRQTTFKKRVKRGTSTPGRNNTNQTKVIRGKMSGLTAEAASMANTHHARTAGAGAKKQPRPQSRTLEIQAGAMMRQEQRQQRPTTTRSLPRQHKSLFSPPCSLQIAFVSSSAKTRFGWLCLVLVTSRLLLLAELEVLAACDDELLLGLALLALQPQGHLLRRLGLNDRAK